jgi:hypothetical protein
MNYQLEQAAQVKAVDDTALAAGAMMTTGYAQI